MSDTPKTDALQEAFNNRDGMQVGDIIEAYEHARVLEVANAVLINHIAEALSEIDSVTRRINEISNTLGK